MSQFFQLLIYGIQIGAVYALVALGYTMVYGIVDLINFAHGDFLHAGSLHCIFYLPVHGESLCSLSAYGNVGGRSYRCAHRPDRLQADAQSAQTFGSDHCAGGIYFYTEFLSGTAFYRPDSQSFSYFD